MAVSVPQVARKSDCHLPGIPLARIVRTLHTPGTGYGRRSKPARGRPRTGATRSPKPAANRVQGRIDTAVEEAFENVACDLNLAPSVPEVETPPAAPPVSQPLVAPEPGAGGSTINYQPSQELLPARMLNEFVYCPRLFYYEFVEGVFVHNADTMRGAAIHTRVDSGSGAMPPADGGKSESRIAKSETEEPAVIHSRSVSLGSDRLGVTAKIDLVEIKPADGQLTDDDLFAKREVCPVDYKAGAPREGEDGKELWDADKMQLGLQCLLLRDNGYSCNEGIIYYRATKQRVRLVITPELETWVSQKIREARDCAAGAIPPPLVDSPKCPRCSLVTVCLPDETRILAARAVESFRVES